MVLLQNLRTVVCIQAQVLVDDGYWVGSHQGTTPINVDCKGYNYARAMFLLGATDFAVAELSLYESDTTTDGDFVIIAAANFATAAIGTLPAGSGATGDNTIVAWYVDLRKRKRYLRINAKGGNGSVGAYAVGFIDLDRSDIVPSTTTTRGVAQQAVL